jgi:hypothetical protein
MNESRKILSMVLCIMMIISGIFNIESLTAETNNQMAENRISTINSVFAGYPPEIDGMASTGEWDDAVSIELDHGFMLIQNDASNLYIFVDLTGDTKEDDKDYFSLSFDVNNDRKISPRLDMDYGTFPGTRDLGIRYYLGPGTWTSFGNTHSDLGSGFGKSLNSEISHRIWELSISLPEIKSVPDGVVNMGLKTTCLRSSLPLTRLIWLFLPTKISVMLWYH